MSSTATRPVIGLDFGTTNSCVSFVDALGSVGRVSVATGNNPPYDRVLASIVIDPLGSDSRIGLEAEQARETRTTDLYLAYFKHLLDSQRLRRVETGSAEVETGEHNFVTGSQMTKKVPIKITTGGEYSREELVGAAGLILERLIQQAIEAGAGRDSDLLLGVPVTFSGYARKRLIAALHRVRDSDGRRFFSGYRELIRRVRFILEPVAVAAAPGEDLEISGTEDVLIFDHGGGTLDLSLVRFEGRAGFDRPVPIRELSAGGSDEVAGRHIDAALMGAVMADPEAGPALRERISDEIRRRQSVESCKRELSTKTRARLPLANVDVDRRTLDQAIAPLLAKVQTTISRTLQRADVTPESVGWVVMTGGSSLIPAVQDTVMRMFPKAAARDRVLRYFPDDRGGVESAITDVADGLALYGQQQSFQRVVLWDVELAQGGAGGFVRLFDRGKDYDLKNGVPELTTLVAAGGNGTSGKTCFGIYENQLDRRFMFGLAEVPALREGDRLGIRLRPDSLFPAVGVLTTDGRAGKTGDVSAYSEGRLEDFIEADAEYAPLVTSDQFEASPLVRKLRCGDYIEWSRLIVAGKLTERSGRGRIEKIRPIGETEGVAEMTSWNTAIYEFTVKTGAGTLKLESANGFVRLSPRPYFRTIGGAD